MKWVKKQNPEHVERNLDDNERKLLLKSVQGRLTRVEEKTFSRFLSETREQGFWIACDCKSKGEALLTVTCRQSGTLFLTHMNKRGLHRKGCPLESKTFSNGQGNVQNVPSQLLNANTPLKLHVRGEWEGRKKRKEEHTQQDKTKGSTTPRLARLLYSLIQDATLNHITRNTPHINRQYQALIQAACRYTLDDNVSLKFLFWTHPKGVLNAWKILKEKAGHFRKPVKPYGLAVILVDRIDEKTLICTSGNQTFRLTLSGPLRFVSGRLGKESAPYLVILSITDNITRPGFYSPYSAFVTPVLSKAHLVPVDSRYERDVLKTLMRWVPWWKQQGITVTLEKPLFDETVFDENGIAASIRPDILINTLQKSCYLEVGGSHESDYLERKKRMHALMEKKRKTFNFDAFGAEQNKTFDKTLTSLLKRLSAFLLK